MKHLYDNAIRNMLDGIWRGILIGLFVAAVILIVYSIAFSQVQQTGDETRVNVHVPISSMYTGRTDYQKYSWTIREALQIRAAIDSLTGAEAVALPAGTIQIRYGSAQGDSVVAEQATFTPDMGVDYPIILGDKRITVRVE